MALSKNDRIQWADIQNLYNKLNTARQKFTIPTIAVPDNPGKIINTQVTDLSSQVDALSSNKYLVSIATTGVTAPSKGEVITPTDFSIISTTIDNIQNACIHDAANHTTNYGAHYASHRSSNYGAHYGTHRSNYAPTDSYDAFNCGSHRSGDHGGNNSPVYGTHYSSNYGHKNSNFSSNKGFNSDHTGR